MDSATVSFLQMLRDRAADLMGKGEIDEAIHAVDAAVEKAQSRLSPDEGSVVAFVSSLEVRGDIFRQIGHLEKALDDYRQAIMVLKEREGHDAQLGRLYAGKGAVHDMMDRTKDAEDAWNRAVEHFEAMDPPGLLDVAAMCNNLAFLRRAAGDYDKAETYFLKALEISHRELGSQHEETALLCNNLGACYQAAGFYDQAREMHVMALETRKAEGGDEHPDTAQSHNNLALAMAMTGETETAEEHFELAIAGFKAAGEEYAEEVEAVTGNFAEFLRQSGNGSKAAEVQAQLGG